VIYVAAPPSVKADAAPVRTWTSASPQDGTDGEPIPKPKIDDVIAYLEAFYHGLPIKLFPAAKLSFTVWGDEVEKSKGKGRGNQSFIALNTPSESVRIRTRATPGAVYPHQLNLDDLLDAAISIVPADAYALLLLVDHDIFEDDDDDFACGRAYGGSRVAVVSSARYDPCLDGVQEVDREHAWPASHCQDYVERCCRGSEEDDEEQPKRKKLKIQTSTASDVMTAQPTAGASASPLQAALRAHNNLPSISHATFSSRSLPALSALYLARLCRTSAHELGHCLGLDHCVYYACSMQGTASLTEDARQPMYLCPIDLRKVLSAVSKQATDSEDMRMKRRYEALAKFCTRFRHGQIFAAFGAWLEGRLQELQVAKAGVYYVHSSE
jgi:archaemetzincin